MNNEIKYAARTRAYFSHREMSFVFRDFSTFTFIFDREIHQKLVFS